MDFFTLDNSFAGGFLHHDEDIETRVSLCVCVCAKRGSVGPKEGGVGGRLRGGAQF